MANIYAVATDREPQSRHERTHARLLACALDLFERQGYERTTARQIASAAGVSEMTFFRHFPAKHSVVLDDPYDVAIAAAVSAQPRHLDPLRRAVRGLRAAWEQVPEPEADVVRRRVRIVAETPSLHSQMRHNNAETERLIVDQLVAGGTDPLRAEVAAAATLGAVTAALFHWATRASTTLGEAVLSALDTLEGPDG